MSDNNLKLWEAGYDEYHALVSNCCGVSPANEWFELNEMCSKCKEHCDYEMPMLLREQAI